MSNFLIFILSCFTVGCGAAICDEELIGVSSQKLDDVLSKQPETPWLIGSVPPKQPVLCDYPEMMCGNNVCVNVSRDGANCGWCGEACGKAEICYAHHCVDPTFFGFSEGNLVNGPVPYNQLFDLPRPVAGI